MTKQEFALPAVGALIFNQEGKLFLMQSSGKCGDSWIVPGGKVNFGETMEEALHREIKEETNMDIRVDGFLGMREFIGEGKHFIFLEFKAYADLPQEIILNEEAVKFDWFSKEELANIKLFSGTEILIKERWLDQAK